MLFSGGEVQPVSNNKIDKYRMPFPLNCWWHMVHNNIDFEEYFTAVSIMQQDVCDSNQG
jgi:hypothetical protein